MQTRYRAAATALLLTATAGLAATGGAAQASGTHHASDKATKSLTVTIKSTKSAPKLSTTRFRPGKTLFKVVRGNAGGEMQILRLKSGYSLKNASSDFGKAFGAGNVKAIRRIDKNVVFYGGIAVPAKGAKPNFWGTDINKAGKYYVLNLDKNNLATFKAKGTHQRRSLPATDGWLNMATSASGGNVFKSPGTDPHRGWMSTTNNASEPHFVVLNKVKESTTKKDVNDYIASTAGDPNAPPPSWALRASTDTGFVSPGHTIVWKYHLPIGKYIAMCFWPSKADGTPHFYMGMYRLFHLN
jgi:hypothetical protein